MTAGVRFGDYGASSRRLFDIVVRWKGDVGGGPCFGLLFALTFVLFSVWALACAFWFGLVGMGLVSGGWSRLLIDVGGGSLWTAWWLFGSLGVILGVWMVAGFP